MRGGHGHLLGEWDRRLGRERGRDAGQVISPLAAFRHVSLYTLRHSSRTFYDLSSTPPLGLPSGDVQAGGRSPVQ